MMRLLLGLLALLLLWWWMEQWLDTYERNGNPFDEEE